MFFNRIISNLKLAWAMPRVSIDLMSPVAGERNDRFYERITLEFLRAARRRHPRFPLVRALEYGVALCDLRAGDYMDRVEASGRRNVRKARRLGYVFKPIQYNDYLDDIAAIRSSTTVRQGELSPDFIAAPPSPCRNPSSLDPTHAYPYFGVLKDGVVTAYAGVLIAGELAMIEHIYGHADHHPNGVVPLLLVEMAASIGARHPGVRYYGYGAWFGAGESMQRFKKKFLFLPHRVRWVSTDRRLNEARSGTADVAAVDKPWTGGRGVSG